MRKHQPILDDLFFLPADALADNFRDEKVNQQHQGRSRRRQGVDPLHPIVVLLVAARQQHGRIERFLVGEVLEQQSFRNTRRRRQFARGGAVESLVRKDAPHGLDDGRPPFLASMNPEVAFAGCRVISSLVEYILTYHGVKSKGGSPVAHRPGAPEPPFVDG